MSDKERARWKEFDPSTFTFIGRNDVAVDWITGYRSRHGLKPVEKAILLGSGSVEPFTIASLPGFENAQIYAVEINPEIAEMGERVKNGEKVTWNEIAERSANPGQDNKDLLQEDRLKKSFSVLDKLGSLRKLPGMDLEGIEVPSSVSGRVHIINTDAVDAFVNDLYTIRPDFIGDFFVQVNVNKGMKKWGKEYTREMLQYSLSLIDQDGMVLIGDTGKNLPTTLEHFSDLKTKGRLNVAGLVHAVNYGSGYITSHYLLGSKLNPFPGQAGLSWLANHRIRGEKVLFEAGDVKKGETTVSELSERTRHSLNLGFVSGGLSGGTEWSYEDSYDEVLSRIVPSKKDEFSRSLVFPAQKPHLEE